MYQLQDVLLLHTNRKDMRTDYIEVLLNSLPQDIVFVDEDCGCIATVVVSYLYAGHPEPAPVYPLIKAWVPCQSKEYIFLSYSFAMWYRVYIKCNN